MSNNLNQGASIEAEQAAFEKATVFGAFAYAKDEFGVYIEEKTRNYFNGWQAARRTPAAATGAAPSVKTWQERIPDVGTHKDVREAMQAEIADLRAQLAAALDASTRQNIAATAVWKERDALRAQLAAKGQGEPVAWGVMENGKLIHTSYHKRSAADWLKYNKARTLVDLYLAAPASAQPASGTAKRLRDLAARKITGEIPVFEYSLAADRIQDLEGLLEQMKAGAQPDQRESAAVRSREWQPVTAPGQVRKGDKLRFKIGDKEYSERAKLILRAGTDKEEVIYDKGRNFYFITAMVMSGFSNHKCVEVLATAQSPAAQPAKDEQKGDAE